MSITIKMNQDNTGIQMSGTTAGRNKTQDTKTRSTVFAGDLMLGQGNQIEQKKQTARRQAMKLITDAWGRDELQTICSPVLCEKGRHIIGVYALHGLQAMFMGPLDHPVNHIKIRKGIF